MSLRDPASFETDLDSLEDLERESTRLVAHAMWLSLDLAVNEFATILTDDEPLPGESGASVGDRANYLGEDLTRMAMEGIGVSRVPEGRLFGAIDYKVARLAFSPEFAVEQALLIDSKAEKSALNNCRVQATQTSLEIRQFRSGANVAVQGTVSPVWKSGAHRYLTTTIFVKYHYTSGADKHLKQVTVATLPHGFLQERYNPSATDDIWNAGPDAPSLGERFRTRLNYTKLENKASWRVQRLVPGTAWSFRD